jgi:hypothetical protein
MTEPKSVVLPLHHGSITLPSANFSIGSAKIRVDGFPPKWFLKRKYEVFD